MIPKPLSQTILLSDGREITIETGKLAKQAHGSVVIRMGDCMLLSTVVSSYGSSSLDFLPLTVDYREKFASAGRFPGGFFKREARPSSEEILTMRIVDRVLRPLFPKDYHSETQVMIQLMSSDENVMPDALVGLAASAALSLSDIPFDGPISEVRVGRIEGEFVINPSRSKLAESDIDIMVGASEDSVVMVEGEFNEISEEEMADAIKFAHEEVKKHIEAQKKLIKMVGISSEKREYDGAEEDSELEAEILKKVYQKSYDIAKKGLSKNERSEHFGLLKDEVIESYDEETLEEKKDLITNYFYKAQKKAIRDLVLNDGVRLDGRKTKDIRDIWTEVGYLPSTHGSAVFTRGETQSLTSVTLGSKVDEQMIDGAMHSGYNKFILHYNFPGFSTGEVRPNRGPGRREVGHGNLAMRALKPVLPSESPYTIRIVSDILESNGSSSMATVCAGTLALMDAGIQITKPVSGIAMGMISEKDGSRYSVLSDILGDEDHLGDMDFKVTGTRDGITACQMDIKVDGLSYDILEEAMEQAKKGRLHILDKITDTIEVPRAEMKPNAPRLISIVIDRDMIGAVIGPGGKVVQEIQRETGATVVIEETPKGGLVNIFAVNKEVLDKAANWVKGIVAMPEEGEVYDGKVKSIMPFGAFIEFMPGKDGLLHISEVKWERLEKMEGIMEVGEEVKVKLIEIDKKTGKYRLSRKVLLPKPE